MIVLPLVAFVFFVTFSHGFVTQTRRTRRSFPLWENDNDDDVVRSPLRFLGPYPTMPLRFPHLATASQRSRNVTGISLDFVLDTAANTNTINQQVALELELEQVGEAPGGVGAGGGIQGGATYLLGDCELDLGVTKSGIQDESRGEENQNAQPFVFMQGLTASSLPVASPAAAGLLSFAFFYCFEGGVDFAWGQDTSTDSQSLPSVTFYGSSKQLDLTGMRCIPFENLPVSMLPAVTLCINGLEIPALFDTGSPITVLNARAAQEAGITMAVSIDSEEKSKSSSWNPFNKIVDNVKSASAIAEATSKGQILTIAGTDGQPVRLLKSKSPVQIKVRTSKNPISSKEEQDRFIDLAGSFVFIGDLPGLAALGGLGGGDSAPPAAVLGMDVITRCPRVVFRAQQKEIYLQII